MVSEKKQQENSDEKKKTRLHHWYVSNNLRNGLFCDDRRAERLQHLTANTTAFLPRKHLLSKPERWLRNQRLIMCRGQCLQSGSGHRQQPIADRNVFFTAIDGTKRATGKIFNRFRLEGDPSVERILRANISGDVSWAGRLYIEGGSGRINSSVEIWITLIDETDNNRTIEETTLLYDECDISAVFPTACLRFPQGSTTYNIAADLQRGHTYRLSVAARCTSDIQFPAATAGVACTFYDDVLSPNGVSRAAFRINIEKDLEEEIERLREDVDRLQDELGELRELFRDHSHLYKTGRGEGHNSENATSSSPIRSD